jgi:hypothetical protein
VLSHEKIFARLEKEVEDLKTDKSAKDVIITDLQQRLGKLEAAQNFAS